MMELSMVQKQGQTLSPQMIQSMEVLQMSSQELLEYLENAFQENPVLELQEGGDAPEEVDDLSRRLEWLEANDPQNRDYHRQDAEDSVDPLRGLSAAEQGEGTLYLHLLSQMSQMELDGETAACARFLAASLNGSGWLEEELSTLAAELGVPRAAAERALSVVQSLDPAGVGARNLSECLRLQLIRRDPVDQLAVQVAEEYLEDMAKSRYGLIARALGTGQEQARRACEVIRTLDPRPGMAFAPPERTMYITPDVIVTGSPGRFELLVNDRSFPSLHLSSYYIRLLRESDDKQVRDYLTDKMRRARWTIRAVEQRQGTLIDCAQCILELQEEFFCHGPGHLRPLTLADVAARVGVHESTVSRAVNGKYLQCVMGTYPLSYFFSRRLGPGTDGRSNSPDGAKALLKRLIAEEDRHRPLSDQKLCQRMTQEGCVLSRRTVAKYRDELGIPGACGRKAAK